MTRFTTNELTDEQREIAKKSPYSSEKLGADGLFECHYKIEDFLRPPHERFN